jgi:flagellar hook assembly protein FlgD
VKRFLALIAVVLAFPGIARAGDVTMVVRDVPLHDESPGRALASVTPRFNMVGLHWQGLGTPWYRTRSTSGRWGAWQPGDDDWGRIGVWRRGNPDWVGAANAIQIRNVGHVMRVREYLLWSPPVSVPARRLQIAGSPTIIPRSGWQADEEIRRAAPSYAPTLQFALVHHTVNANNDTCAQSASIVRGIEVYHVKGNGWNDIGYNLLVDKCGQVFEGRYGGVDKNVIGAHSQGFNTGSVGVALIGTYQTAAPATVERQALVNVLAWRLDVAHIDPLSFMNFSSGGNSKFPAGIPVNLRAISAHRDTYSTDCPGDALYKLIPSIAQQVAATGGPKLYAPVATGTLGGPVRFTGKLTASLPWTVTVRDAAAKVVAAGAGTGTAVDWTWDSKGITPGASYTWVISAGTDVRPATGTLGAKAIALALTKASASPARIDGTTATSTTVSYTLSAPANVTAELLNSLGTPVATLFADDKPAGAQSFVFTPTGVPDGNYTIRLTARDTTAHEATASVAVLVSRTLVGFAVDDPLVSPNGDGRFDTATFAISLAAAADVTLTLDAGTKRIPIFSGNLPQGDQELPWSGPAADGSNVPDGVYSATITIGAPPLALSQSVPLTVDTTPPKLILVSLYPLRLKVDDRASVIAVVNGKTLKTSAKPGVFRLAFRGTIHKLKVVVRDRAGNESKPVNYPHR